MQQGAGAAALQKVTLKAMKASLFSRRPHSDSQMTTGLVNQSGQLTRPPCWECRWRMCSGRTGWLLQSQVRHGCPVAQPSQCCETLSVCVDTREQQ